jgi:uncharacterized protein YqhQ
MGEKWSPSCFLPLQRTWVVFKGRERNIVLYKIIKMPLLMPLVLGVSIFDLVQFWAKINNQTDFFLLLN